MNALSALTALSSFVGRQTGSEPAAHARSSSSSVGLSVGGWQVALLVHCRHHLIWSVDQKENYYDKKKKKEEAETRNLLNR